MAVRQFRFTKAATPTYGNTVIDQMASRMAQWQAQNGNAAVHSFEIADADWHWLGVNTAGRAAYKPAGAVTINQFVEPWGVAAVRSGGAAGDRAFEGHGASNVQLLVGAGGPYRSHWDVDGDAMWHIAGPTGYNDFAMGLTKYDAATDQFVHWTAGAEDDTDASLWPLKGAPHNFGTSAWDQTRRRLFKLNANGTPSGTRNTFWPCWANVANEVASANRTAWLTDRDTWFDRVEDNQSLWYIPANGWPQTVFAPHLGATGSLIIFNTRDSRMFRWDQSTRTLTEYATTFNYQGPDAGPDSGTVGERNCMIQMLGEYMYVGSSGDGINELWRFHFPATSSSTDVNYTLETDHAPCPVPMDGSGYGWPGTNTQTGVLNGKIYAFQSDLYGDQEVDPPELALDGGVYVLEPTDNGGKGSWTQISGSWYQKLLAYSPALTLTEGPQQFTLTEIPRLGVFLIAAQTDAYATHSWLFKPPA